MDPTPNPAPEGVATLSVEEILALEQKIRENKAAQLQGLPPPHTVTVEQIAAAINGMRSSRGTMNLAKTAGSGKKGNGAGKSSIEVLDLEGL